MLLFFSPSNVAPQSAKSMIATVLHELEKVVGYMFPTLSTTSFFEKSGSIAIPCNHALNCHSCRPCCLLHNLSPIELVYCSSFHVYADKADSKLLQSLWHNKIKLVRSVSPQEGRLPFYPIPIKINIPSAAPRNILHKIRVTCSIIPFIFSRLKLSFWYGISKSSINAYLPQSTFFLILYENQLFRSQSL